MTDFFSSLALRIFSGGIICCVALTIVGDGAKKEVVRLCCACLMVIFVLTPIKGASFSLTEITGAAKDAEAQIGAAVNEAQSLELNSIAQSVAQYAKEQAEALGLKCITEVEYSVDGQNVFHIDAVYVRYIPPAKAAVLSELRQIIARDCGVGDTQIFIYEEETNEN